MSEQPKRKVLLPPSIAYPNGHEITLNNHVLVVIGANGAGKTRYAAWLEEKNVLTHRRVAAHRSLRFPEKVSPTDIIEAENKLAYGWHHERNPEQAWKGHRWQDNPVTALLNDFEPLVTLLVSESFVVSDRFRVSMRSGAGVSEGQVPSTRLDIVRELWEEILPLRELLIRGSRIEARPRGGNGSYHAQELSDGERGIFYLIAEALSVPANGVFIVDEPELHLNRAIQARLWDRIERTRPDCTFIYITHDLGFAASRSGATKVWLREFTSGKWEWEVVPETQELPEPLLLEVMGSRRPIRFVEGTRGSLDAFVYGLVFPDETIVPCGSCELVIHATATFANLEGLHHNICRGIVDNDGRPAADISMLQGLRVAVLGVAQVENLFLLEGILRVAAKRLGFPPEDTVEKVKLRVFSQLEKNRVRVASNLTRQEMEPLLKRMGAGGDGAAALASAFTTNCAAIDPAAMYARWETEVDRIVATRDYPAALRLYKSKGLAAECASPVFNVRPYTDLIMRWLREKEGSEIVAAMKPAVPLP